MPVIASPLARLLLLALLVAALAGCGAASPSPAAPSAAIGAEQLAAGRSALQLGAGRQAIELLAPYATLAEAAPLLARARATEAAALLAATPADAPTMRAALDLVLLAIPLAPADPPLLAQLSATQRSLVALLAVGDARAALAAQALVDDPPGELTAARALAAHALAAAQADPAPPGANVVAADGLLAAAAAFAAHAAHDPAARGEAQSLCEQAAALDPANPAAQACLVSPEREPVAAPPAPVTQAPRATQTPRATEIPALPDAPSYTLAQRKSFEGSGASGQFASCIDVQILAPTGPVSGAVIGINNGDHSFQNQTDANGYTGRCGLGASTWSVVLFWTPAGGTAQRVFTTIYLSGAPEQRAAVVFQGR